MCQTLFFFFFLIYSFLFEVFILQSTLKVKRKKKEQTKTKKNIVLGVGEELGMSDLKKAPQMFFSSKTFVHDCS